MAQTWRVEATRNGSGNLVVVAPDGAPDWVDSLASDLMFRLREAPACQQIIATAVGEATPADAPEESPDATPQPGPVTSTGPGSPPPDATS